MVTSYGIDRTADIISVWCTDLRRSLRKIAESRIASNETLVPLPRPTDRPNRPSRFRIVTADEEA